MLKKLFCAALLLAATGAARAEAPVRLIIAFRRAVRWTWWAACWPSSWARNSSSR